MEDYLSQFRLGALTQSLAWLDCGSGADGLEREWDLGPDGAHGLSPQERDAVRYAVPGARSIWLEAARVTQSGITDSASVISDGNGRTTLRYERVA